MLDANERWEQGIPHRPESIKLFEYIADIDFRVCGDRLCLKWGGDGDNGEHLMYLLDMYFESQERQEEA